MREILREERPPTEPEARTIRARGERRRQALTKHAAGGGDALFVAALGAAVALVGPFFFDGFFEWVMLVFGGSLLAIGAVGFHRQRRSKLDQIAEAHAATEVLLDEVWELRLEITRVLAVSDPHGEGETYWVCERPDGSWLVLSGSMWDPAEEPPETWREEVTLVVDRHGVIVRLAMEGAPVEVERRDVRAPGFEVTDEHRFWEPPPDLELPGVVEEVDPRPLDDVEA